MKQFNSTVAGIPCIIEVTEYYYVPEKINALPEHCYPEEFDFEFNVLDRKGYPAEWLERKLTDLDYDRIFEEFREKME